MGFVFHVCYTLKFGPTPGRRDNELRGKMARRSQIQKDLHHVTFPRAIRDSFECHGFGLFKNGKTVAKMCPKAKDPDSSVAYSIETLSGEGREKSRSNAHSRYSSFCNLHPSQQCYMAMVGLRWWRGLQILLGHGRSVQPYQLILFANSAAKFNPIAYTICHENFRDEFRRCLTCNSKTTKPDQDRTFKLTKSSFSRNKPRSPLMQVAILPVCRPSSWSWR